MIKHVQFIYSSWLCIIIHDERREKEEAPSCSVWMLHGPTSSLRLKTREIMRRKQWRKQTTLLMEVVIEARSKCWCKSKSLQLLDSFIMLDHCYISCHIACIPGLWSVSVTCCFHNLFLASLFGTCGSVGFDLSPCYQDPTHMKPSSKHDKSNSIKWNVN